MMGPGGSGLVEFVDSVVMSSVGSNRVNVNHHCGLSGAPGVTGGMCASHYVFSNVDFVGAEPVFYSETRDSTSYGATDVLLYYGGETLFDSQQAHPTFSTAANGCYADGDWTKCPDALGIRNVRIYSPDRGSLTVTTSEGSYSVQFRDVQRYMGSVRVLTLSLSVMSCHELSCCL